MPASGVPYKDGTLFCSQGNLTPGTGGLYYMPRHRPPVPVVTNHFGWDFNSVQGVALAPTTTTRQHAAANRNGGEDDDVAMYFTDPCHGADGGFRPSPPQLPNQVYRFVPSTGELRVVADGMGRPHGIAVSPDGDTVYVSDADAFRADGECDLSRYGCFCFSVFLFRLKLAFDVVRERENCIPSGGAGLTDHFLSFQGSDHLCVRCRRAIGRDFPRQQARVRLRADEHPYGCCLRSARKCLCGLRRRRRDLQPRGEHLGRD